MGHIQALRELMEILADAFDQGLTESEASYTVDWRGYSFEVSVRMDPDEKPST
jgi:hypothetical protein